jgi:hypothetical protein
MTLSELRLAYPQYQDLPDEDLIEGLHRTFYADLPLEEVQKAVGYTPPSITGRIAQGTGDLLGGALRGAGSIGATILSPVDAAARALNGGQPVNIGGYDIAGQDRRAGMDAALTSLGANTQSLPFQAGKIGAEVAGTMGVGGALGNGLRAVSPGLETLSAAMSSGGLRGAGALAPGFIPRAADIATRVTGGAISGGASAGLADPQNAGMGAAIGGAIPGAGAALGALGRGLAGTISPEVQALGRNAYHQGIQVPLDRMYDSNVLNRITGGLEHLPLSGRQSSLKDMERQIQTAASRTMGQDTPNVTQAVRSARTELGNEFDRVLRTNSVNVDDQLISELNQARARAIAELEPNQAKVITDQADEILKSAKEGPIEGQTAYNIKKTLDRISPRPIVGVYARDVRGALLGALNRSLGPEESAGFAQLRQQYGNMAELSKLAKHGGEGDISMARLGNMSQRVNPDIGTIADIASQFGRARSSPHSLAQYSNAMMYLIPSALGGLSQGVPGVALGAAATLAGGRGINALMNSDILRRNAMGMAQQGVIGPTLREARQGLYLGSPTGLTELMRKR